MSGIFFLFLLILYQKWVDDNDERFPFQPLLYQGGCLCWFLVNDDEMAGKVGRRILFNR